MAKAFEEAGVNIVICAISAIDAETSQSQKNLIRAAEKSTPTERFVVSSFDLLHMRE